MELISVAQRLDLADTRQRLQLAAGDVFGLLVLVDDAQALPELTPRKLAFDDLHHQFNVLSSSGLGVLHLAVGDDGGIIARRQRIEGCTRRRGIIAGHIKINGGHGFGFLS